MRCSPKCLSLDSSHAKAPSAYASGYLPALASKEGSHSFQILIAPGSTESSFWVSEASQRKERAVHCLSYSEEIEPTLFRSLWFISSLSRVFSPVKICFARCRKGKGKEKGKERCWSCPSGHTKKNCRIQDGKAF